MYPMLQSAVATLSSGPVGIGDKMENIDRDLVMKSCRSDGKLLQPGKPLTATDVFFLSGDQKKIWTAETRIDDTYTFGLIFSAEVDDDIELTPEQLNLQDSFSTDRTIVWQHYPAGTSSSIDYISLAGSSTPVQLSATAGAGNFKIWGTAPVFEIDDDSYAFLGEQNKWAPISLSRVLSLDITATEAEATIDLGERDDEAVFLIWKRYLGFSYAEIVTVTCSDIDRYAILNIVTGTCHELS